MVHLFSSFLSATDALRTPHGLQDRLSLGLRLGRRLKVAAEVPYLGGPYAGPCVCHLRALHPSGLHSRLEGQREQIQVSMPRQRIRQRRCQLRGTSAASHGPGTCGIGSRWPDRRGYLPAVSMAQGAAQSFQRTGIVFAGVGLWGRARDAKTKGQFELLRKRGYAEWLKRTTPRLARQL